MKVFSVIRLIIASLAHVDSIYDNHTRFIDGTVTAL